MISPRIFAAILALLAVTAPFPLIADSASEPAGLSLITPDQTGDLTYVVSLDGKEQTLPDPNAPPNSQTTHYFWIAGKQVEYRALTYGDSKKPGPRYLRVSMANPVTVGSILTRGGGLVSVLKPDAAGDVTDDSQWIPAQRLEKTGVSAREAGNFDVVVWTLPQPVTTKAIRFSHQTAPTDRSYAGSLGAFALFSDRFANVAPQALATASVSDQSAPKINDENSDYDWKGWDNISSRDGTRDKTIQQAPEWVGLTWPTAMTLSGIGLLGNEYGAAEIQTYVGSGTQAPSDAPDSDWKTVQTLSDIRPRGPVQLDLLPVAFDAPVATRALRIRFTSSYDESSSFYRMKGNTRDGKRVGLAECIAFQSLGSAPLETALLPVDPLTAKHGPIPIKFTLPENGEVTLVIEDPSGKRVRNLVSQVPFPKGENTVWWDGTDDLKRDVSAADHGVYYIPPELVAPGTYTVRGLWHKPLDLRYEFSVYSPGDPPWSTSDASGGWMTNHTPASCVVFIPANKAPGGQPLIGLGAAVSEGGSAFAWLNLEGRKLGGRGWIGGPWTGAYYLAGDSGPNAEPGTAAYVGSVYAGNKKYGVDGKTEIRLTKLTTLVPGGDRPVLNDKILLDNPPAPPAGADPLKYTTPADYLGGIAVYNGLLVLSETALNKIVFVDVKAGSVLGEAAVPNPRGLAFDSDGKLLVLSGQTLLRYPAGVSASNLPTAETLVTGLDDPRGLTIDPAGKIYVADQGASNQVKVYDPSGKSVATYGKAGPSQAGPYDPLHMNHPKGIAVDTNNRLWVAEDDFQPKRVSVWNPDGTLWKAYYGSSRYGGGGIVDAGQVGTFLYDGMEFKLDWDKGEANLSRIYYRPGKDDLQLGFRDGSPESAVYFNGHRYLTDTYNSNPVMGQGSAFIFLDKGDGGPVVPVAAAGSAFNWPVLKGDDFKSLWPAGLNPTGDQWKNAAFFLWSDLNGDGKVEPNEVKIVAGSNGGVTVADDGSFLVSRLGPDVTHLQALRFKPVKFTAEGAPVYDMAGGEKLAPAQTPGSDGGDQVLAGTDGWTVMTTAPPPFSKFGLGGAKNGTPAWSYPSLWPGLHASHSAPAPSAPGMLIGTTRLLGGLVTPKGSQAEPLFFINSNQGDIDAFTEDGLFVSQVFEDVRQGPLWEMPVGERNMRVNGLSLHDENFFPSVAQTTEGKVYLNTGGAMALVRIDNLDTIRTIAPWQIQVSASDLTAAQDLAVAKEAARQATQGTGMLKVAMRGYPPAFGPDLSGWGDAQWVTIDHRGVAAWFDSHSKPYDVDGAVTVAEGKLFAAWKTGDPKLLQNAGDVPNALFKSGGALDLMIGADGSAQEDRSAPVPGDERLLVAQVDGKTKALLYRAVVPGTQEKDKVPFNAPWHGITLDRVDDVSGQVVLTDDHNGDYEVSIPLSVLGLQPQPGLRVRGDIGVLRGDGRQTNQRVYWANKATAIVSDVPTEAELTPRLWGIWEFQ